MSIATIKSIIGGIILMGVLFCIIISIIYISHIIGILINDKDFRHDQIQKLKKIFIKIYHCSKFITIKTFNISSELLQKLKKYNKERLIRKQEQQQLILKQKEKQERIILEKQQKYEEEQQQIRLKQKEEQILRYNNGIIADYENFGHSNFLIWLNKYDRPLFLHIMKMNLQSPKYVIMNNFALIEKWVILMREKQQLERQHQEQLELEGQRQKQLEQQWQEQQLEKQRQLERQKREKLEKRKREQLERQRRDEEYEIAQSNFEAEQRRSSYDTYLRQQRQEKWYAENAARNLPPIPLHELRND